MALVIGIVAAAVVWEKRKERRKEKEGKKERKGRKERKKKR
jgi:hypothetical protein